MEIKQENAREYFESLRWYVLNVKAQIKHLKRLEYMRMGAGSVLSERVSSSTTGDNMGASRAYLMKVEEVQSLSLELEQEQARAKFILFGADGVSGISALVGADAAAAVMFRYVLGLEWLDVVQALDCSRGRVYRLCAVVFDYIDSVGFARVKQGQGSAAI